MSVVIESGEGVLRITLDRPSRKNALDVEAVRRIVEALEGAATDEALRAVVLHSIHHRPSPVVDGVPLRPRPVRGSGDVGHGGA